MQNENIEDQRPLETAPVLAAIRRLQDDRAFRDGRKLFFIEGVRNFISAVDHHYSLDTLAYSEKLLINPIARKLVRTLKRAGVPFVRLSPEQFRAVSRTERASGIAAIARQRIHKLDNISPDARQCWTVLSHIRSPGNLGTLLRTSAATGSTGFILLGSSIDPFDPMSVRAAMGALFRQVIVRATPNEFVRWVGRNDFQVVGASPDGAMEYDRFLYKSPTVVLLGTERSGLSPDERLTCDHIVKIPMVGGIDSLNVAVAGSLLLYEIFRSRGRKAAAGKSSHEFDSIG